MFIIANTLSSFIPHDIINTQRSAVWFCLLRADCGHSEARFVRQRFLSTRWCNL